MTGEPARILVIKLGALGDFVQALGPFAAIRRHHPAARVTLLTTTPYEDLARASGLFDEVWLDSRPRGLRLGAWWALRRRLRRGGFQRVYDLQTSDRSSLYYQLLRPGPMPEWSGIAWGCSHFHANPGRDAMHTLERQAEQLRMAGVSPVPPPDLSWADANPERFGLSPRFALLVPGGAPHRPAKRWPTDRYAALAGRLVARGLQPVLLGAAAEASTLAAIAITCPEAVDLTARTSILDLAVLGRRAVVAVGNDTGPMHLIAVAGCRSVVLYSRESDPALCAQRGREVVILRRSSLEDLSVDEVEATLDGG